MKDLDHKLSNEESDELEHNLIEFFALAGFKLVVEYDGVEWYCSVWTIEEGEKKSELIIDTKKFFFSVVNPTLLLVNLFNYIMYNDIRFCWHLENFKFMKLSEESGKSAVTVGLRNGKFRWKPFEFDSYSEFKMKLALRSGK